ncbi:MAG: DNA-binding protein [Flavobacteriales bacterium]|nr:DNA-binding protein [Flavobacteriales bacterium]|tara:strand:- start:33624 stop:33980 length:357 start_codon:yes stop_codon:yes gene_type:complete
MAEKNEMQEIFSRKIRAGRRTYFFDVRSTKAGDYYMTITESIKDFDDQGVPSYRKHKIYLYKEEFNNFKNAFSDVSDFIISEKGEEIISSKKEKSEKASNNEATTDFTEVNFEDLGKD